METKERLEETEKELELAKDRAQTVGLRIHERAMKISTVLGWGVFWTLLVLFVFGLLIQFTDRIISPPAGIKIPLLVLTVVLGTMNVVTGFNIRGFREKMVTFIASKIEVYLKG